MTISNRTALWAAVSVPVIYYGTQVVSLPHYPGYSLIRHQASLLGSDASNLPALFNAGALLCAGAMAVAAWGIAAGLRKVHAGKPIAYLTGLAVFSGAFSSLNAGLYPLPDPRHNSSALVGLSIGFFLLPVLLLVAMRRTPSQGIRWYLVANLIVYITLVVLTATGGFGADAVQQALARSPGLFQRVLSATVFLPIGVCGYQLLKASKTGAATSA